MTERSKQIFGNNIASGAYRKAVRSKQKFIRKFGDDSTKNYPTSIKANPYIGPELGVSDIRVGEEGIGILKIRAAQMEEQRIQFEVKNDRK